MTMASLTDITIVMRARRTNFDCMLEAIKFYANFSTHLGMYLLVDIKFNQSPWISNYFIVWGSMNQNYLQAIVLYYVVRKDN